MSAARITGWDVANPPEVETAFRTGYGIGASRAARITLDDAADLEEHLRERRGHVCHGLMLAGIDRWSDRRAALLRGASHGVAEVARARAQGVEQGLQGWLDDLEAWATERPVTLDWASAKPPDPPEPDAKAPRRDLVPADIGDAIHGGPTPFEPDDGRAVAFPIDDGLPDGAHELRSFFESAGEAMQVPVESIATLAVSFIASAYQQKAVLDCEGWKEYPPFWTAVLMSSGARKSEIFRTLRQPITDWQARERKRLGPEIAAAATKRRILEQKLKGAERKAASGGDTENAVSIAQEIEELDSVTSPEIFASEGTPEGVAKAMEHNGERMLIAAAEGEATDIIAGRYHDAPTFGVYLSGYGAEPDTSLRAGRERRSLEKPLVTVGLIIQPTCLAKAFSCAESRGRGFLARFVMVAPKSTLGHRKIRTQPIPAGLRRRAWDEPLTVMLGWTLPEEPMVTRMEPKALDAFDQFREDVEPRLDEQVGDLGDDDVEQSFGSKLPGMIARLSLALECWQAAYNGEAGPPALIRLETMQAAIGWGEWLIGSRIEAERVARSWAHGSPRRRGLTHDQRKLVAWIRDRGGEVTARETSRTLSRFKGPANAGKAKQALKELEALRVGRFEYRSTGKRGKDVFVLDQGGDDDTIPPEGNTAGISSLSPGATPENAGGGS